MRKVRINDNIYISSNWDFSEFEIISPFSHEHFLADSLKYMKLLEDQYIWIQGKQFRVIPPYELLRKRNERDGYYRVIYIQINFETCEYYIGKANRPTWNQLQKYQGSGIIFREKYKKHQEQFVRYYIAVCKSAEETEKLESIIVNETLLTDEKCLNLVKGGGGTSDHPSIAELRKKKSDYMRAHPELYKDMLNTTKKLFSSGNTLELKARNESIKRTMGSEKYRKISRERILDWKKNNPEKYQKSRENNKESIRKSEVQSKRVLSLNKWKENNPEKYREWEKNRISATQSQKFRERHKKLLKKWAKDNPEQAKINAQKRSAASSKVNSKPLIMKDLKTGEVLKEFINARAAAKWLLNEGKTQSKNAAGSIGAVCLGRRQKAYGYLWSFINK